MVCQQVKELDSAAIKKSTEQDDKSILSKARKTSVSYISQYTVGLCFSFLNKKTIQ